jgi:hypothetical protein
MSSKTLFFAKRMSRQISEKTSPLLHLVTLSGPPPPLQKKSQVLFEWGPFLCWCNGSYKKNADIILFHFQQHEVLVSRHVDIFPPYFCFFCINLFIVLGPRHISNFETLYYDDYDNLIIFIHRFILVNMSSQSKVSQELTLVGG